VPRHETLIVLDFGSQVTQLIARRVRELGVYAEIHPCTLDIERLRELAPLGVILSGGPSSTYEEGAPGLDPQVLELGVPVLGICYGLHLMVRSLGGEVIPAAQREYGAATITIEESVGPTAPFAVGSEEPVWMSHGDRVERLPAGFRTVASSDNCTHAAVVDPARRMWAVQFHPEVSHTPRGTEILSAFVDLCGFARDWSMAAFVDEGVARVREQVGARGKVICGLSGGVDSSVAALLVEKAIGARLHCIFVDNGLLRKDERAEVERSFESRLHNPLIAVDASARFLTALRGVDDPEEKRRRIGATFIDVFEEEAKAVGGAEFLVQGTLYPDVIESAGGGHGAKVIKSHHNVGGLPERMKLELIEPLRQLFKDEVRVLGRELGLPGELVDRHPFPGPGLAVRILGAVNDRDLDLLRCDV
jgi:GMP synthase (glutamine-hydrolysing)